MSPQTIAILFSVAVASAGAAISSGIMAYRHRRARRRAGVSSVVPPVRSGVPRLVSVSPAPQRRRAARRSRQTGLALSVGAVAVFGSLALTLLTPENRDRNAVTPQHAVIPTPGKIIEGLVSHVRDGDTIEMRGVALRLEDLDCAEMGTAAGARAKRAMTGLTKGQTLLCRLTGAQTYDRWIATCTLPDGRTLSQAMIAGGYCTRYGGATWR